MKIAIIPARAGSKRLPGKNLKLLCGKPLIAWSIEAARDSQLFDLILVSTDSKDIAAVAETCGAIVSGLRPAVLASDTATINDVVSHIVTIVEQYWGKVCSITLLQPTSPLRKAEHIIEAHRLYENKAATSVISVCQLAHSPQLCNTLPADHSMSGFLHKKNNVRSQDFEPCYRINGAIYIFDRIFVGALADIYGDKSYAFLMKEETSIDIDNLMDFEFAEFIMLRQCNPNNS